MKLVISEKDKDRSLFNLFSWNQNRQLFCNHRMLQNA
jgi:hypothetical protein